MKFIFDWLAGIQLNPVLKERNRVLELQVSELIKDNAAMKQELAALKSEIENARHRAENLKLDGEHDKPLNNELVDSRHNTLDFDKKTGTWLDTEANLRYCPTCKGNHAKHSPLKDCDAGWQCTVCNAFFTNPDYKVSPIVTRRTRSNQFDGY